MKGLSEEGSVLHCEIGSYITVCYARPVTIDQEGQERGWEEGDGEGDGNRISRHARLRFPVAS